MEDSNNYSKISSSLWQYCSDESDNTSVTKPQSFKSKLRIRQKAPCNGNTKDVETPVPLMYLSNFCEINLSVTGTGNCIITNSIGARTLAITDTKLYVLLQLYQLKIIQKLLQQMKSGITRININQK